MQIKVKSTYENNNGNRNANVIRELNIKVQ